MKKIFSLILAAAMLLSLCSVQSFAADNKTEYLSAADEISLASGGIAEKPFTAELSDFSNKIKLSFRMKVTGGNPYIRLHSGSKSIDFYFEPGNNRLSANSAPSNGYAVKTGTASGEWNTYDIILDLSGSAYKYLCYVNGSAASPWQTSADGWVSVNQSDIGKIVKLMLYAKNTTEAGQIAFSDISVSAVTDEYFCNAAADAAASLFEGIKTDNITLPVQSSILSAITWTSLDADLISNSGVITRPADGEFKTARMIGRFECGESAFERRYDFTIMPSNIYLYETFESPKLSETMLIEDGQSFNGWLRQNGYGSGTGFKYSIAADGENQYLDFYHTGSDIAGYRTFSKQLGSTIPQSEVKKLSFKAKMDAGYNGLYGITIGGAEFIFRTANGYFYPGNYANSEHCAAVSIPTADWASFDLIIYDSGASYELYKDGAKVTALYNDSSKQHDGKTSVTVGDITGVSFRSNINGNAGTANKHLYFDDIVLSTLDEAQICAAAADSMKTLLGGAHSFDIELPAEGVLGTEITWTSKNPELISDSGKLSRPETGTVQTATLTALIKKGSAEISRDYTVKILSTGVAFYDDFETAGSNLIGYNKWSGKSSAGYTEAFKWGIEKEADENKAASVKRIANAGSQSAYFGVTRALDAPTASDAVSVKYRFKKSGSMPFSLILYSSSGSLTEFSVYNSTFNENGMYLGGRTGSETVWCIGEDEELENNVWYETELVIDMLKKTYDVYFDGALRASNVTFNKSSSRDAFDCADIASLTLAPSRTVGSGSVSFDDISISAAESKNEYNIEGYSFKNADGEACTYPVSGGTLSGITVKKIKDNDGAAAVIAVYDADALFDVKTVSLDGLSAGETREIEIGAKLPENAADIGISAMLVRSLASLTPICAGYEYEKSTVTVFIAGDSTAEVTTAAGDSDREGWGMELGAFFDENVVIKNMAMGGCSTKTFIDRGRLAKIISAGKRGDYVLIQFAHNDQGQNITSADYKSNLEKYAAAARSKGMIPVYVTPIARRAYDENGKFVLQDIMQKSREDMIEAANKVGAVCIDLTPVYVEAMQQATEEELDSYYVSGDGTHPTRIGAKLIAGMIKTLISGSELLVREFIK